MRAKRTSTPRRAARGEGEIDHAQLVGQAARFEAATGVTHGPVAVVVAVILALAVRPLARVVRRIRAR